MKRSVLAFTIGVLAPLVFLLGASLFEGPGGNSAREMLAGSVALALYLAVGQFAVARRAADGPERRTGLIAMLAPLTVIFVLILALESQRTMMAQALPMFLSGSAGGLTGWAWAARNARRREAKGLSG